MAGQYGTGRIPQTTIDRLMATPWNPVGRGTSQHFHKLAEFVQTEIPADVGRLELARLVATIQPVLDRMYPNPRTRQDRMSQLNKILDTRWPVPRQEKNYVHFTLGGDLHQKIQEQNMSRKIERSSTQQPVSIEAVLEFMTACFTGPPEWPRLAAGLELATGLRIVEILAKATPRRLRPDDPLLLGAHPDTHLHYSGLAKSTSAESSTKIAPVFQMSAAEALGHFETMRVLLHRQYPVVLGLRDRLKPIVLNKVNAVCHTFPVQQHGKPPTSHFFRAIWSKMCSDTMRPSDCAEEVYLSSILGHNLQHSSASLAYARVVLTDEESEDVDEEEAADADEVEAKDAPVPMTLDLLHQMVTENNRHLQSLATSQLLLTEKVSDLVAQMVTMTARPAPAACPPEPAAPPVAPVSDLTLSIEEAKHMAEEDGNGARVMRHIAAHLAQNWPRQQLVRLSQHYTRVLQEIYTNPSTARDKISDMNGQLRRAYSNWFLEHAGPHTCLLGAADPRHSELMRGLQMTESQQREPYVPCIWPEGDMEETLARIRNAAPNLSMRKGTRQDRRNSVLRGIELLRQHNISVNANSLAAIMDGSRQTAASHLYEDAPLGKRPASAISAEPVEADQ